MKHFRESREGVSNENVQALPSFKIPGLSKKYHVKEVPTLNWPVDISRPRLQKFLEYTLFWFDNS